MLLSKINNFIRKERGVWEYSGKEEESGWSEVDPSPCTRGRAREGEAWLAGLGEAPAPGAPGVVEEEEEEGVLETGPFDTTTNRVKHTGMDCGPLGTRA